MCFDFPLTSPSLIIHLCIYQIEYEGVITLDLVLDDEFYHFLSLYDPVDAERILLFHYSVHTKCLNTPARCI